MHCPESHITTVIAIMTSNKEMLQSCTQSAPRNYFSLYLCSSRYIYSVNPLIRGKCNFLSFLGWIVFLSIFISMCMSISLIIRDIISNEQYETR